MKKIFTIVIITLLVACSKSDNKTGNVELTGNVEGLKQGKLYIQQLKDTNLVIIDSIIISGESNFETKFQIEEPQMLFLSLDRGTTESIDNSIHFFAEPGKMKIETTLQGFYANAKISGSENQKVYEKYLKIKTNLNDENLVLLAKEIKNNVIKNAAITEEINNKRDKLTVRKYLYTANFALVNPKYEVSPYITLTEIPDANLKLLDTISKTLDPKVAKSKYGKRLNEWIKERKSTEEK
ncbi:DUF4369 domain-containing protein [Flavobacterium sp. F372]|uniref:DUF4369 domain-containing protein n=1 Tax=Flavobacterium bernardetii TaxID=2813823 RepID=A0ABR7IXY5_9FLAO|nr:DUF4369 domain-containing protein [Flavobacterium bernardetii]MBC5834626.1 DUF4369 domain-containing protein [Flavobacterium bernardetii]NHF70274.1 DUF4369 domain-containing protein [Flavobacterium bernardetii]